MQVPLPIQEVIVTGWIPWELLATTLYQHSNHDQHYPASKASCFHFLELPRVAGNGAQA